MLGRAYCGGVKLSVKSDYATRAVLALARYYPNGGARRAEEVAQEQGIPANYVVQILILLKSKQIVSSRRGKEGGYLLARSPAEITLGDILRSVHGEIFESPAVHDPQCPVELRQAWLRLQKAVEAAADEITFQTLLEAGAEEEKMFYI